MGATFANPVLDLLEGKSDGLDLFPRYFEEKPKPVEPIESEVENVEEKREYVASKFPSRNVPVVNLYANDRNRIVQQIAVDGQVEVQAISADIEQGSVEDSVSDSTLSKGSVGVAAHFLYLADFESRFVFDNSDQGLERLVLTLDLTDSAIPVHNSLQRVLLGLKSVVNGVLTPFKFINGGENYLPSASVNPVEAVKLRVGKFKPRFGSQYNIDSSLRLTPNAPQLIQQIAPANALGVEYSEYNDFWNLRLGWFSNDVDEFVPSLEGRGLLYAGLGYNFGNVELDEEGNKVEFQEVRADYFYNDEGTSEAVPGGFNHLFALSFLRQSEKLTFSTDFLFGESDTSTVWGANLTSGWWIAKDFIQLVGQYQHANSDNEGGIAITTGIPGALADSTHASAFDAPARFGDFYNSFYAGFNFYFLEQRLRVTSGLEYRILSDEEAENDIESWTWQGQGLLTF